MTLKVDQSTPCVAEVIGVDLIAVVGREVVVVEAEEEAGPYNQTLLRIRY